MTMMDRMMQHMATFMGNKLGADGMDKMTGALFADMTADEKIGLM